MAWEWSHTQEAYDNAHKQLYAQSREWLEIVFAEWHAKGKGTDDCGEPLFSQGKYNRALKHAKTLPDDTLAEEIWERMEALATCDNGGWNAWACPYGCGCHTVPFDPPENEDDIPFDLTSDV